METGTMPRYVTTEQLANEIHPNDPDKAAEFIAAMRQAATEKCSVCGIETYRIHAHDGPILDSATWGRGIYDICEDCMSRAKKTADLLGWTIRDDSEG
jgi:hypothetical protein